MRKKAKLDDDCGDVIIFDPKDGRILQGGWLDEKPEPEVDLTFPDIDHPAKEDVILQELEEQLKNNYGEVMAHMKELIKAKLDGQEKAKGEFPSRKDQFKPGVSGNPGGRRVPLITNFVRHLLEVDADQRLLSIIAAAWIRHCIRGNPAAMKEFLDRIDGPTRMLPIPPISIVDEADKLEILYENTQNPKGRPKKYVDKESCETSRIDEYEAGLID